LIATDPRHIPVIIGTGEAIDRANTQEPRALIAAAARQAAALAPALLARIDALHVVYIISWRYADIAATVAEDLGAAPAIMGECPIGGEQPIRLVAEAAARIAAGQSVVALVCGAEALRTRAKAAQAGTSLGWGPSDANAKPIRAADFVTPQALRYGLAQPVQIYPLYENATRHAWGQTAAESDAESAVLWSRYADAAKRNPYAWLADAYTPAQILADTPDNRMIAYPYRKLMVANPSVNQGAAILITSLAAAREASVPEDQLVYVWGGARANEARDFLQRDRYDRSAAQDAVLHATLEMAGLGAADIDLFELYSCFPTVPKMARRTLGLGEDMQPSVTGGLTFFGGPGNNYMTHAVAAAVRALRAGKGHTALLYGQGEFVTKHAALILADRAPDESPEMRDVQDAALALADAVPALLEDYEGPATVETFTIVYDRVGAPQMAPVVLRTSSNARVVALATSATVEALTRDDGDPVGAQGTVERGADGVPAFWME
jgi:hypothetical protein